LQIVDNPNYQQQSEKSNKDSHIGQDIDIEPKMKQEIVTVESCIKFKYKGEALSKKQIKKLLEILLRKCKDSMNDESTFKRNNLVSNRIFKDLHQLMNHDTSMFSDKKNMNKPSIKQNNNNHHQKAGAYTSSLGYNTTYSIPVKKKERTST
jgi:hypothetical protein